MIQDRQGAIWVAARRGLFRYFNGRWSLLGEADGYGGAEAFSLYEDRAGHLWVGTAAGVYERKKETFELVDPASTNVQSLAEDASGGIWVTDSREVLQRLSTHTAPQHEHKIRLPTGAWRLLRDRNGQIWAAAFGGGLMRVRDPLDAAAIIERYEYEHRLAGSPRSLFEDREGNIWVGMRGGLLRLSESVVRQRHRAGGRDQRRCANGHRRQRRQRVGRHRPCAQPVSPAPGERRTACRRRWHSTAIAGERCGLQRRSNVSRFANGRLVRGFDAGRDSHEPGDGGHDGRRRHALAVHGTQGCHDLGRKDGHPVRWTGRPCRSCVPVDLHGQAGTACGSGSSPAESRFTRRGSFETSDPSDGLTRGTVLAILEDARGAVWFSTSAGVSRYPEWPLHVDHAGERAAQGPRPGAGRGPRGLHLGWRELGSGVIRFHPSEVDKLAANPSYQLEYSLYDESDGMQLGLADLAEPAWAACATATAGSGSRPVSG